MLIRLRASSYLARLVHRCPAVRLPVRHTETSSLERTGAWVSHDGLARGNVDLLIGIPKVMPDDHEAELVYRDPMLCIVRKGHPKVRTRLSLDAFASLPHVDLALFDTVDDTIDRVLSKRGRSRNVQVALPHFSSVPLAIAETDCVATLSSRLARMFAERLPLRVLEPPVKLDPIEVRQVWHRRSEVDVAVGFLRAVVRDAALLSAPRTRRALLASPVR